MILNNRYFKYSAGLCVLQQLSLAASTYFIALAGIAFAKHEYDTIHKAIICFFSFALLAYLLSSLSEFFIVKLKNDSWEKYIHNIFAQLQFNPSYSSMSNKQTTTSWLSGEANSSLYEVSHYCVDAISIYCNIIFTISVFGLALGPLFMIIVATSLVFSFLVVTALKNKITNIADSMQFEKLNVLVRINKLWENNFFANKTMRENENIKFQKSADNYFKATEKNVIIEQTIACLPVYTAVPLIIVLAIHSINNNPAAIGALVAVLPRTLQLFGSVHSLSLINSKFPLIRQKLNNLKNFVNKLSKQELEQQIDADQISIRDLSSEVHLTKESFLDNLIRKKISKGRYLITGSNGAGKSSLLKLIKYNLPDAIFIQTESNFLSGDIEASSGEKKVQEINSVLKYNTDVYLLDEWDANLDPVYLQKVETVIQELSINNLVIEVRHMTHTSDISSAKLGA